ncbi:MAG: site-specific integrase, partial [Tissierellales bacterium]|nr:site-specific integrase [Tissierellales bacterium]
MAAKRKLNAKINGNEYYRIRVTVGTDSEGKPIRKNFYGKGKTDAEKQRDEYLKLLEQGVNPDLAEQPLKDAMYSWLWNIKKHSGIKSNTFSRYEGIYRNYIEESSIGKIKLIELKKIPIQKYYKDLLDDGKSHSVVKNINKLLKAFLNYAVEESYILKNPVIGLKLPKKDERAIKENNSKIETFTTKEINKLIKSIGHKKLKYIVLFAFYTGARKGEILALKKSDINDGYVNINKQIGLTKVFDSEEEYSYEYRITRPKSKTSNRKIPLPDPLIKELKKLDRLTKEEKLRLGPAYEDNNLLFPSLTGTYINDRNLSRSWERALESAGIKYRKFHCLRHTYVTLLLEKGAPMIEVSRLAGHSSVAITQVYAHPSLEAKKKTISKLNDVLS